MKEKRVFLTITFAEIKGSKSELRDQGKFRTCAEDDFFFDRFWQNKPFWGKF